MRTYVFVILFAFALLATRLFFLDRLPATLTHDELVYATQAYSYTVQGTTLDQKHTPLSLTPNDPMYAELPATLLTPGMYLSNNVLVASHLIPALMSVLFPLIVGWLVWGIWKERIVAVSAAVLMVFNPLVWQFGRMSYDVFFSTFFYMIGAAIIVNLSQWWKLTSLLFFFLGFFQYQGFKLILIPFVVSIILLKLPKLTSVLEKKTIKNWVPETIIVAVLLVLTAFYGLVLLPSQNTNDRLSRTIFSDREYLTEQVNRDRKLSISSEVNAVFTNKVTETVDFMLTRTIETFDPTLLFLIIPPANHGYTVWTHGLFYLFEGLCIILGFFLLFSNAKRRTQGFLLLLGILFLNLSNLINTDSGWSLLRGVMSYTLLLIVASFGLAHIVRLKNKLLMGMLIGVYIVNILNFSYQYYYRYPVMSLDLGNFDERVISRYISLHQKANPEIPLAIYAEEPWFYLYSYLLYTKSLNSDNAASIAKQLQEYRLKERQVYRIGNLSFANTCVPQNKAGTYIAMKKQDTCINDLDNTEIALYGKRTFTTTKPAHMLSTIASIQDSGVKYVIHNDFICNGTELNNYVHLFSHEQLAVENLSPEDFCRQWITNIKN